MVSDEVEPSPEEVVAQLLHSPLYGQGLLLNGGVVPFMGEELTAHIGHWVFLSVLQLGQHRSNSYTRGICLNNKGL